MRGTESKFYDEDIGQSMRERVHSSYLSAVPDSSENPKSEHNFTRTQPLFNKVQYSPIFQPSQSQESFFRLVALISIMILIIGMLIVSWPKISGIKTYKPDAPPPIITIQPTIQIQKTDQMEQQITNLGKAVSMLFTRLEGFTGATTGGNVDSKSQLVEVIALKANLRVAPSKESSAVIAISKGTTLLVDRVEQNWFRVYSPNGELLWISADVVTTKQFVQEYLVIP